MINKIKFTTNGGIVPQGRLVSLNPRYAHPDSREARRLRKRKQVKLNRNNK